MALRRAASISFVIHALMIGGVGFALPNTARLLSSNPLDVVLVNSKSTDTPDNPDALAQADLDGGGNTDSAQHRMTTPLPPKEQPHTPSGDELAETQLRQRQLEQETQRLLNQIKEKGPTSRSVSRLQDNPEHGNSTENLMAQTREMERLEGQIQRETHAYQTRPRRSFIGARTRNVVEARYVDDWRVKIERVGNLNYPVSENGNRLYGKLRLTVEIRADGSVEQVTINRSSGNAELDAAAQRIVRLASPFAGFSEEMRRQYDILGITRTWTFSPASGLTSVGD